MAPNYPRALQQRFELAIARGELARGRIVTCPDMAKRFQASPEDMRLVLYASHRKGLVRSGQDRFEILGLADSTFDSIFQYTSKSGLRPDSAIRTVRTEPAAGPVADILQLAPGGLVYRLDRTRNVNGEAVANQVNFIPYELCPGLEEDDLSRTSFQKLLETKYYVVLCEMKEDMFKEPTSESDLSALGNETGPSVLVIRRLGLGFTGCPLVLADIRIRPDRYRYVAGLWPKAATLLEQK